MHDPAERAPLSPKVEPRRAAAGALPTGGGAFSGDLRSIARAAIDLLFCLTMK